MVGGDQGERWETVGHDDRLRHPLHSRTAASRRPVRCIGRIAKDRHPSLPGALLPRIGGSGELGAEFPDPHLFASGAQQRRHHPLHPHDRPHLLGERHGRELGPPRLFSTKEPFDFWFQMIHFFTKNSRELDRRSSVVRRRRQIGEDTSNIAHAFRA